MGDFELARGHYIYTLNTTTTGNVTNDANGFKMKLLGNIKEFQLKDKNVDMQVFKRVNKQYHGQH